MKKIILLLLCLVNINIFSEEIVTKVAQINGLQNPSLLISKDGKLYAYGYYTIYSSSDNGSSWEKLKDINTDYFIKSLVDVKQPDGKVIFFANFVFTSGSYEGFLYYSLDSCKTWKQSSLTGESIGIAHVFATPSNKLFYVDLDPQGVSTLYISEDYGETSRIFKDTVNVDKIAEMPDSTLLLYFYKDNKIINQNDKEWRTIPFDDMVISNDLMLLSSDSTVFISRDKGLTMEKTSIFRYDYDHYRKFFGDDKGNFYALYYTTSASVFQDTTFIYKYDYINNKWDYINWTFDKVDFIKKSGNRLLFNNYLGLLKTDDEFKAISEANNGLDYIKIQTITDIFKNSFIVTLFEGISFVTENNGISWKRIVTLPKFRGEIAVRASYKTGKGHLLLASRDRIYCSQDKGATWKIVFEDFSHVKFGEFYEDTYGNIIKLADNNILVSTDDGINWINKKSIQTQVLYNITEADGMYAVTSNSGVYVLNSQFNDFTILFENFVFPFITTTSQNNTFALGFDSDTGIYYSAFYKPGSSTDIKILPLDLSNENVYNSYSNTIRNYYENTYILFGKLCYALNNKGEVIQEYNHFLNDQITSLSKSKNSLFASTIRGNIYQFQNPLSVDDIKPYHLKIYPNPASDYILIEDFQNINNEKIEIIDQIGNIIDTEIDIVSNNSIKINMNKFKSGIYFIKINGDFTKFIKID